MSFRCPHCGEEIQLLEIPQNKDTACCPKCGQEFSISGFAAGETDDQRRLSGETWNGGESTAPQQEGPGLHRDELKALAQQYFADLPNEPAQENSAPAPEPIVEAEKNWSPEDELSEEDKRLQRAMLFQFAQQTASKAKEAQPMEQEQASQPAEEKSAVQEKRWQRVYFRVLLSFVFILPLVRVFLSRAAASVEQFNWMQPQIVPSLLYWIAAVILLFSLLRRTAKPRPMIAALLFIPLVFDFWYLIPGIEERMQPDTLLYISSGIKIAVSAFALIMSLKPRKHPTSKARK